MAPPVRWEKTQPRSRNRQAALVESTAISSSTLARTCTQSAAPPATAASPANGNNNVRIDRYSAVIHLEAISSIVLPN